MARRTKEQNLIISRKVNTLMNEGFELKQAQAIAFRMFKDGELPTYSRPKRRRKGYNQMKVNQVKKLLGFSVLKRKKRR